MRQAVILMVLVLVLSGSAAALYPVKEEGTGQSWAVTALRFMVPGLGTLLDTFTGKTEAAEEAEPEVEVVLDPIYAYDVKYVTNGINTDYVANYIFYNRNTNVEANLSYDGTSGKWRKAYMVKPVLSAMNKNTLSAFLEGLTDIQLEYMVDVLSGRDADDLIDEITNLQSRRNMPFDTSATNSSADEE